MPNRDTRKQTGRRGEDMAATYLAQQGYEIVQRNWRCSTGEVDIIARKGNTLIFVEVRTRRSRRFGTAEESITPAKQARLMELAQAYLQAFQINNCSWQIDVIAIQLGPGLPYINHIENAVGW